MSQLACPAGTLLFTPGQECPGFVRLTQGTVRVSLTAANGREVVLYRVGPGDVCLQTFACLTDGRTYSAEGIAETALSGEVIPHADFRIAMTSDDAFRTEGLTAVARRFGDYEQLVEDVALTGFDARLARVLLRLADEHGHLSITHDALAAETASGRAFVSRRLRELSRQGLLQTHRGGLQILDRGKLIAVSQDER